MGCKRSREQSDSPPSSPSLPPNQTTTIGVAEQPSKYAHLDTSTPSPTDSISCALPPHGPAMTFSTYDAYEVHYQQTHANRCADCGRNFPTEHFLGLHIAESHDPLNQARKARGEKIYACFVEGCDRVCSAPARRRLHLIDKHLFPKDYDFGIVNHGIDKRASMLRSPRGHRRRSSAGFHTLHRDDRQRRRSATLESLSGPNDQMATSQGQPNGTSTNGANGSPKVQSNGKTAVSAGRKESLSSEDSDSTDGESPQDDRPQRVSKVAPRTIEVPDFKTTVDVESLVKSMSALRFVPPSVRLGAGKKHG